MPASLRGSTRDLRALLGRQLRGPCGTALLAAVAPVDLRGRLRFLLRWRVTLDGRLDQAMRELIEISHAGIVARLGDALRERGT